MKFLVTGGAGFIGSELCRVIVARGHELVVYDDLRRGRREYVPGNRRVSVIEGDVRDAARVREVVRREQPGCVVHLAALHYIPDCIARPDETLAINVGGTKNVLDACSPSSGAPRVSGVLIASSAAVYAPSEEACREDSSALGPLEVYGETKVQNEEHARAFQEQSGIPTTSLRIFNALGPRETNPHVVPHVFQSLQRSDVIPLGNLSPRRDYVHTRDIARAILACAERARGYAVYNIGSGLAHSVAELIEVLRKKLARPITVQTDPARVRPVDRQLLLASTEKIRVETGWTPEVSFEECLEELIDEYSLPR